MNELFGLGIVLEYTDKATSGLLNTQRVFSQMTTTTEQAIQRIQDNMQGYTQLSIIGSSVSSVGNTIADMGSSVIGAFSNMTEEAKNLDKELSILKFTSGLTGDAFEELRQKAMQTGMETMFSPQEAVQGLYELISAGLDAKSSMESLNDALDFSTLSGGVVGISESTALMASTLKKFNLDASESTRIVDQLAEASRISNFHFQDFSAFMNSIQSSPATTGRPLEEFLAMGGMLRNVGQGAAQAGTTVNGFARQITNLTAQLEGLGTKSTATKVKLELMKNMGLDSDTIWDADNKLRPFDEVLGNIIEKMANMDDKTKAITAQKLFGDQAKNIVFAVENATKSMLAYDEATGKYVQTSKDGKMTITDMKNAIRDSTGVAKQGVEDMENTTWGLAKLLEGIKQTLNALLGETIVPLLNSVYKIVNPLLSKLVYFLDQHPKIAKITGMIILLSGAFLLATGTIMKLFGGFLQAIPGIMIFVMSVLQIARAMGVTITSVKGFTAFLSGGLRRGLITAGLAVAKFSLIIGGMYLAWKHNFLGVRSLLNWFITSIKTAFSECARISNLGSNAFLKEVARLQDSNKFVDNVTLILLRLKWFWIGLTEAWKNNTLSDETFQKVNALGLLPLISHLLDLKEVFKNVWEGIKIGFEEISKVFRGIASKFSKFFSPIIDTFKNIIEHLFEVKDASSGVVKVTDGINADKWRAVGEAIAWVVTVLGSIKVVFTVIGILGKVISLISRIGSVIGVVIRVIGTVIRIGATILRVIGTIVTAIAGIAGVSTLVAGLIVAGVVAVVALIIYYWDEVWSFLKMLGNAILAGITFLGTTLLSIVSGVVVFIEGVVGTIISLVMTIVGVVASIVASIAGLIVAGWNIVKGLFATGIETLKTIIVSLIATVTSVLSSIGAFVKSAIEFGKAIVKSFIAIVVALFTGNFTKLKETLSNIWGAFADNIKAIWSSAWDTIRNIFSYAKDVIASGWNSLKETWSSIMNNIKDVCKVVVDNIKAVWSGIGNFFTNLWTGIKDSAKGMFDWISEKFEWVTSKIDKVKSWFGGGSKDKNSGGSDSSMVGLATGGYVKTTGIAVLHPNEVVVNDDTTRRLQSFLSEQEADNKVKKFSGNSDAQSLLSNLAKTSVSNSKSSNISGSNTYDYSINLSEGAIQINAQNSTTEEAERLAKEIMQKIKRLQQLEKARNYN